MDNVGFKGLYSIQLPNAVFQNLDKAVISKFGNSGINCVAKQTQIGETVCYLDIISFGRPEDEMAVLSEIFPNSPITRSSYREAVDKYTSSFMEQFVQALIKIHGTQKLTPSNLENSFDTAAFRNHTLNMII